MEALIRMLKKEEEIDKKLNEYLKKFIKYQKKIKICNVQVVKGKKLFLNFKERNSEFSMLIQQEKIKLLRNIKNRIHHTQNK